MRRSPLIRRKPMPRHAAQVSANTDLSSLPKLSPPPQKRTRETGFPAAVRKLIDWRDSDYGQLPEGFVRCQAHGQVIRKEQGSRQHRIARHMGGTRNPVINSVINGLWVCGSATTPGSCHRACEDRNAILYDRGFWRPQSDIGSLPLIPVVRWDRRAAWPTADGRWLLEAPAGEPA